MKIAEKKNKLHIFGGGLYVDRAKDIALEHGWNVIIRSSNRFRKSFDSKTSDKVKVIFGNNLNELMKNDEKPEKGDIGLSFSAPWLISSDIIQSFDGNIFNLHGQLLPNYRGAGGFSWNLMQNDREGELQFIV